jgi:hypothetical protein
VLLHHRCQINIINVRLCRLFVLGLLDWNWSALNSCRFWSVGYRQLLLLNVKINGDFLLRLEILSLFGHVSDFKVWCRGLLPKSSILVEGIQKRLVCLQLIVKNKTRRSYLIHCDLRFYG